MITHYDWAGGREALWRFGPDRGPVVIVALPLFEEANRTRTFMVRVLRLLAERGIAGALPDLPGQGESVVGTDEVTLAGLRAAFAAASASLRARIYSLGIRSGALLDGEAALAGRWHLSPVDGTDLVRELMRTRPEYFPTAWTVEIMGNEVTHALLEELGTASPASPARTVRMASDPRPADLKLDAAPLWRRAEPGDDPALAALIADDIATWVRACEG